MIQGTSSDAGKSVLVAAFCRIFKQQGYRTAPFKSQNMALNSYITVDGHEIGRAQGVQAEACGIEATTNMNPILIKPSGEQQSQIVVHGKPYRNMKAAEYRNDFFASGLQIIQDAYQELASSYERIVIEGAGSPAEINLNERELVNMRVARLADAPVILVTDIERGGAFASLVGTLELLEPEDRERVIGVIINKFRGDPALLQPGLDWFEKYTGKPVLGVMPYIPNLYIDAEDSLILDTFTAKKTEGRVIDIAVIRYPRISNFTDMDPFSVEPDCSIRFVSQVSDLGHPDVIILPGSKNTLEDLKFLREQGMEEAIRRLNEGGSWLVGICGGYQMLGSRIADPYEVESSCGEMEGIGLLPMHTVLTKEKKTTRSYGKVRWGEQCFDVSGYEIHMGQSEPLVPMDPLIETQEHGEGALDIINKRVGTYFHGIFHNEEFRWFFLDWIRREKGLEPLDERTSFFEMREQSYDKIAQAVRENIKMDLIEDLMSNFHQAGGVRS